MSNIELEKSEVVNIVDSAVHDSIKLNSTRGVGERRIYIKTTNNPSELNNFFFEKTSGKFLLFKDDLYKYLRDAYMEYNYPLNDYRENITKHYYEILKDINDAPEVIELYFNQTYDSRNRYYLKAERGYLNNLIKYISKICLPRLTKITFVKYINLDTHEGYINIRPYFFDDSYIRQNHPNFEKAGIDVVNVGEEIKSNELINQREEKQEPIVSIKSSYRGWQKNWRDKVLESTLHCAVSKCSEDRAIVACHIKGSAVCIKDSDGNEKNPNNGIMLLPTFHWLFDRGFLTFSNNNKLLLSTHISNNQYNRIGISRNQTTAILNIDNRNNFLEWHRNNIYKG